VDRNKLEILQIGGGFVEAVNYVGKMERLRAVVIVMEGVDDEVGRRLLNTSRAVHAVFTIMWVNAREICSVFKVSRNKLRRISVVLGR